MERAGSATGGLRGSWRPNFRSEHGGWRAMRIHLVAVVAVALVQLCLGAESVESESAGYQQGSNVWVHFDGKWVSAPNDVGPPGLKNAPVTLITFANDGRFFMLQCWISTYEGGQFHISSGNPYRAFEGGVGRRQRAASNNIPAEECRAHSITRRPGNDISF